MNITFYKKHKRIMQDMLKQEKAKPNKYRNDKKIISLEKSITRCLSTLKKLQIESRISRKKNKK